MQFYRLINEDIKKIRGSCTALLGGGGKTALLHKIANELSDKYNSVLQTSLTKTAYHRSERPFILNNAEDLIYEKRNPIFIVGNKIDDNKLQGITEHQLDKIRKYYDAVVFECDGAKNKPLKAHNIYDPKVPGFATNVIVIIGADVVDSRISDGLVHRPELFCEIWDLDKESKLDLELIVKVISSKTGYHSKFNSEINLSYFVNKADEHNPNAIRLANAIRKHTNHPTFYGSLKNDILVKVE